MKLFVLALLVAGTSFSHGDSAKSESAQGVKCTGDDCNETTVADTWMHQSTSTIAPSTVLPTKDSLAGCESCLNTKLTVSDTFAGQCFPHRSNGQCSCLCGDVFCKGGQTIDRTTCVNGGSLSSCRCIDATVSVTTSTVTPEVD